MGIGSRIKEARKARGLSQAKLAKMLGVQGAAVSFWETDTHPPDPDRLPAISDILGIDLTTLSVERTGANAPDRKALPMTRPRPPEPPPIDQPSGPIAITGVKVVNRRDGTIELLPLSGREILLEIAMTHDQAWDLIETIESVIGPRPRR